jgi:tRNA-uridine 2-sulfurtransferase
MSDRYNPQVIDHLVRPRNAGDLPADAAGGVGESGDAACGDVARFSVAVRDLVVRDVRYKVYGCAACVAAGSALTELVSGRGLLDAARVSRADLEAALGGPLPQGKEHALVLVLDALHKSFEDYWNREAGEMLVEGYGGYGSGYQADLEANGG